MSFAALFLAAAVTASEPADARLAKEIDRLGTLLTNVEAGVPKGLADVIKIYREGLEKARLAQRPRFEKPGGVARGSLLEKALQQAAENRAEKLFAASIAYAKVDSPPSGVYYVSEAEGNLRFRDFVKSLPLSWTPETSRIASGSTSTPPERQALHARRVEGQTRSGRDLGDVVPSVSRNTAMDEDPRCVEGAHRGSGCRIRTEGCRRGREEAAAPARIVLGSRDLLRDFEAPPTVPTLFLADAKGKIVRVFYGAPPTLHADIARELAKLR